MGPNLNLTYAKPLTLGRCVGLNTQHDHFVLEIPMLVPVFKKPRGPNASHNEPNASHNQPNTSHNHSTRAPTQVSGIWFVLGTRELGFRWACTFHVVFVKNGFALGTQREPVFVWNMGFRLRMFGADLLEL